MNESLRPPQLPGVPTVTTKDPKSSVPYVNYKRSKASDLSHIRHTNHLEKANEWQSRFLAPEIVPYVFCVSLADLSHKNLGPSEGTSIREETKRKCVNMS